MSGVGAFEAVTNLKETF